MATDGGSDELIESAIFSDGVVEGEGEYVLSQFVWKALERWRHCGTVERCQ